MTIKAKVFVALFSLVFATTACISDNEDPCPSGQVRCDGECIDPLTHSTYCGAQANCTEFTTCTAGVELCNGSGVCAFACAEGLTNCNEICVNIESNINHCGACKNVCASHELCEAGACTCAEGFFSCDELPENGCETDLMTDEMNCGACGVECIDGQSCVAGVCGCAEGFADCDQDLSNGCEVDIRTDNENCGGCAAFTTEGIACTDNQTCIEGSCTCDEGFGDCDASQTTGCETELASSVEHCGACGDACNDFHAEASCKEGACELSCDDGYEDCDGLAETGCESDLALDPENCGGCGTRCVFPNGIPSCVSSGCVLSACQSGYKSCDNNPDNGCEQDVNTSSEHCGDCNTPCPTGQTCNAGRCQ